MQVLNPFDHDEYRWGAALTADIEPRELIRLADVVKRRIDLRTPVKRAAREVINLLRANPPREWFVLSPGDLAFAVDDCHGWRIPRPLQLSPWELFAPVVFRTDYREPWSLWVRNAQKPLVEHDFPYDWFGHEGVYVCLTECWLNTARAPLDLDEDLAARVAILKTDAQRLFNFDGAAAVYQLRPLPPVVPEAPVPKPPAGMEHDGASLLRRQDELKAADHRSPTKQLAKETGLNERKILRRISEVRTPSNPPPSLESAWSGPRKVYKSK